MLRKIVQICMAMLFIVSTGIHADPDLIESVCVNDSDRSDVRLMRSACDDTATLDGYNIGIFAPSGTGKVCDEGAKPYSCFGAPGSGSGSGSWGCGYYTGGGGSGRGYDSGYGDYYGGYGGPYGCGPGYGYGYYPGYGAPYPDGAPYPYGGPALAAP